MQLKVKIKKLKYRCNGLAGSLVPAVKSTVVGVTLVARANSVVAVSGRFSPNENNKINLVFSYDR